MQIWTIPVGFYKVNCYVVRAGEGLAAVVDPGDDAERILALLEREGLRAACVLLTHAHWDHVGAVADVAGAHGAPVMLHRADLPMLEEWSPRPVEPARFLDHGDTVEVGDLRCDVLHTPGHTPGSVCYRWDGGLFSGDTLFAGAVGRWDFPGGSREDLMRSLRERVLTLPDDLAVYPGHGPATSIGRERRDNPHLSGIFSSPPE